MQKSLETAPEELRMIFIYPLRLLDCGSASTVKRMLPVASQFLSLYFNSSKKVKSVQKFSRSS